MDFIGAGAAWRQGGLSGAASGAALRSLRSDASSRRLAMQSIFGILSMGRCYERFAIQNPPIVNMPGMYKGSKWSH